MPYSKIDWNTAKVNPDNLNHMQEQYEEAWQDSYEERKNTDAPLRVRVVDEFPDHSMGQMIFHTGRGRFYFDTGSVWQMSEVEALFGDGADGEFDSEDDVQWEVAEAGDTVIKDFEEFTLNAGHTLTVNKSCRAVIIRSMGNVTIDGEINLDKRGGYGNPDVEE